MISISLIIPSYKNPECLDLCLKSAVENKVLDSTEILVTLDGFVELSEHIIEKYKDNVMFLSYPDNMGMQNAINSAVYQARNSYMFIINEDNVLPTEWDKRLFEVINNNIESTVITVNQIEPTPSIFNFEHNDLGIIPSEFRYDEFLEYEKTVSQDIEMETGGIFPFVINKKYFMVVNGFDLGYPSPHVVDWDFFMRLELLGCTFTMTKSLALYHFGQMSTKKVKGEEANFNLRESEAHRYFEFKWGFTAGIYSGTNNSHLPKNKHLRGLGTILK